MRNGGSHSSSQTFPFSKQPYLLPIEQAIEQLATNSEFGLSDTEVITRQQQYGPNAVLSLAHHLFRLCMWLI